MPSLVEMIANPEVRTLKYQVEHYHDLWALASRRKGLALTSIVASTLLMRLDSVPGLSAPASVRLLAFVYFVYRGKAWAMGAALAIMGLSAAAVALAPGEVNYWFVAFAAVYAVSTWKALEVEMARVGH